MKNVCFAVSLLLCTASVAAVRPVKVDWSAYPFVLDEFVPEAERVFPVTDFGAKPDGSNCTGPINRAIEECSAAGGGRVLVPPGTWSSGALVMKSGVELHLAADAVIAFREGPDDFPQLPSPKGYDERNGHRPAPFIRADGATNVAITGCGELRGNVKYWFKKGVLGKKSRPGFIWFDNCKNVLLSDVKIRQSAFWTIHTRLCTDVVLRRLDVECVRDIATTYTNTDGVDIDSCARVVIEDCTFSQDDDVICMKSGKNETGRKLGVPTEYVAVRRCTAKRGHGLLSAGSELSGGIQNIYMTDCRVDGVVDRFLRVKTNRARGGFARNITIENISGKMTDHDVVCIETDYPESGGVKKPYHYTVIENITARNLRSDWAVNGISINGVHELPAKNVVIEDVVVGYLKKQMVECTNNVTGLVVKNLRRATDGWHDSFNDRRILKPRKALWCAPVEKGAEAFDVEMRDGAEGKVTVEDGAFRIAKTNDRGLIVVRPKELFKVARGRQVRASARVSCTNAEPLKSVGALRLYGPKENLDLNGLDRKNFGAKGPRVSMLVNTPPGTDEIKFSHYQAWGHEGTATPVIIVGGVRSESVWKDWIIEDLSDANAAWNRAANKTKPADRSHEAVPADEFEHGLALDTDHSAKVEMHGDAPRLVVDGKVVPPVLFKSKNLGFKYDRGRYVFTGRRMEKDAGIDIQVLNVPGARTHNYTNGVWTKSGYDAKAAVEAIRLAMRISAGSKFILSVPAMPYPEFCEENPSEAMRTKDGCIVYGNESVTYGAARDFSEIPDRRWAWPSYSSEVWLEVAKNMFSALIGELKRTGMSKRVIGVHICGFRDWQFGTPAEIDWSKAARDAFARRGAGRSYESFIQAEPTRAQNELARHVKKCFAKDVVAIRWCFSAFSGAYTGSYDIGEFLNSDSLDMLVAQPMYINRAPGVPLGLRLPLASFRRHGKIFVNEFDLRTDLSLTAIGSTEADSVGMGTAKGLDMWQSVFRRAAGQMMANGAGWWMFDMAGGWYESARIAADIADAGRIYRKLLDSPKVPWRPSMAVLIDEQGSLASVAGKEPGRDFNAYHAVLASSGVPYWQFLAEDVLSDASALDGMRVVVWFGLRNGGDSARKELLAKLKAQGVRLVLPEELLRLSGRQLHGIALAADAYVPSEKYGLQVDMNGNFVSVHALLPGEYSLRFPYPAEVINLKNGHRRKMRGGVLRVSVFAGETLWYGFSSPKGHK